MIDSTNIDKGDEMASDSNEPIDSDKVKIARYRRDMVRDLTEVAGLGIAMFTGYSIFKLFIMMAMTA